MNLRRHSSPPKERRLYLNLMNAHITIERILIEPRASLQVQYQALVFKENRHILGEHRASMSLAKPNALIFFTFALAIFMDFGLLSVSWNLEWVVRMKLLQNRR